MEIVKFENHICDWYFRILWIDLFVWKGDMPGNWGFDGDGIFAICTPWFMVYPFPLWMYRLIEKVESYLRTGSSVG